MARAERLKLIENIEKERQSKVICYVTSTRKNMESQMAMDAVRHVYDHLVSGDQPDNIDLFLHSNGGEATVPWRLVTLIREHTKKKFAVLIPFRAFSAATLTAVGADEIVMHPMGMMGPTDATVGNAFNPPDPMNPMQRLGISVEDVTAYLALVKEDAGIRHEDELVQAFSRLATEVHPLALGNVKRWVSQTRMMAGKLLAQHMDKATQAHIIEEIVENLTSKSYYHGHPINRNEAKNDVGIKTIVNPSQKVEKLIWRLYLDYEEEMKLEQPLDIISQFLAQHPALVEGQHATTNPENARLVCIESRPFADFYDLEYEIYGEKPAAAPGLRLAKVARKQGWTRS